MANTYGFAGLGLVVEGGGDRLTKAIGKDVAGTGILVNAVAPAVIRTPLLGQMSEEHISYMLARIPLGRIGEPERSPRSSAGSRARR